MKPDQNSPVDDWLPYIQSVHHRSIEMGLDRVRIVYGRLVSTGPGFKMIQVGGTNGKGSCVEMLASILESAGYRVGAYTSPHILSFNERFRVNGASATDAEISVSLAQVEEARVDVPLTYFEFATLAALILFEVKEVDVAIMEAGMGGRLDAVNLVAGIATLITNVSLDHAAWLGTTRHQIAQEKAGLIHKGVPVVIGDADPPTVLEEKAAEFGAPCYLAGRDFGYRVDRDKAKWAWWGGYPDASAAHEDLPPPLGGWDEQFMNAACVLQVLACIRDSVAVTTECCRNGLRRASISCRSQIVCTRPHILLDVAHNPASVAVLRRNLESLSIGGHVYGIFSMIEGKEVAECAGAIAGVVDTWYVTEMNDDRGLPLDDLLAEVSRAFSGLSAGETARPEVLPAANPSDALEGVLNRLSEEDCLVVFGSFHIVSDIIPYLEQAGYIEPED